MLWIVVNKAESEVPYSQELSATLDVSNQNKEAEKVVTQNTPIAIQPVEQANTQNFNTNLKDTVQKVPVGDFLAHCNYEMPENPEYKATVLDFSDKIHLPTGGIGIFTVSIKNEGNVRWFADHSGCADKPAFNLGTYGPKDEPSVLGVLDHNYNSYTWLNDHYNRVRLTNSYVDPGEDATFYISVKSGQNPTLIRQFFAPVIEGVTWIEEANFKVDVYTDSDEEIYADKEKFVNLTTDFSLLGESKRIEVDLSDQKTHLYYGDILVSTFTISSGAPSTPTPKGNFEIHNIQDLRVAGTKPHYLMPNYLSLVKNGAFGFHSLPSLRNDNGIFWTEALNHIGTPVSHGCIRLLPEDSETLKNFVEIGTPVSIQA